MCYQNDKLLVTIDSVDNISEIKIITNADIVDQERYFVVTMDDH